MKSLLTAKITLCCLTASPRLTRLPKHHYYTTKSFLDTFTLPTRTIKGSEIDALGKRIIQSWRRNGAIQLAFEEGTKDILQSAFFQSKKFFSMPTHQKAACVNDLSFSGHTASGEEITDGAPDYSEVFTITPDLPLHDQRVAGRWPCHGPCPWPSESMKVAMLSYMNLMKSIGERFLRVLSHGLDLDDGKCLNKLTCDGWHHMRVNRYPPGRTTNDGHTGTAGVGPHTDYGLLVILAQDSVGGLSILPPSNGAVLRSQERKAQWQKERWLCVPPSTNSFIIFPGDMIEYITGSFIQSTPHTVKLGQSERFSLAYFHEPNFCKVLKPLRKGNHCGDQDQGIHYGSYFTDMFMRNNPNRATTQRIVSENTLKLLRELVQG